MKKLFFVFMLSFVFGLSNANGLYAFADSQSKDSNAAVNVNGTLTAESTPAKGEFVGGKEGDVEEQVVEIGNGGSSDSNLPISNNYRYAWSETLYKSTSFETGGAITKIAYNVKMADADPTHTYAQFKVYMGESDLTQHTGSAYSSNAWAPMSDLTLVFSATDFAYGTEKGWNEIVLDTPFNYSAEKSLVIVIAHEGTNGATFMSSNLSATKASLYRRSDSDASFASHPGTVNGTYVSKYADIQITILGVTIPTIDALTLGEVTSSSATINWESEGEMFDVYVSDGTESSEIATVQAKTYTFEGLEAGTSYTAYVRTNAGETGTGSWSQVSFFTTPEFSGEGTEEVPYEIATVTDMQNLSTAVAAGWSTEGVYFEVKNDIEGVNTIIGTESKPFRGIFNGAQHVINVSIEGTTYAGLFGRITTGSYIHDVVVEGTVSATGNFVGGIVGYIGIEAFVDNCENRANVTGKGYVGGIAGQNSMDGVISNSANKGAVASTGIAQNYGQNNVGGIVGLNYAGYVENSYNLGSVTGTATGYYVGSIGGIAGTNQYMEDSGGIYNVYNAGEVTMNQGSATTGTNTVGALVGSNSGFSGYGYAIVENAYYKEGTYGVAYGAGSTGAAGISNYTSFTQEGTVCTLTEEIEGSTDLLEILNAWIAGNDGYNTWYADNTGDNQYLPCFVEPKPTPTETEIVTGEEQPGYTSNAPFYNNAAYSYDETIYLSSLFEEVGNGTITKIAYDVATAREGNTFEQLKIYMGETDATRYSSTSAWTPQTDLTLVYDGTDVAFGRTTGWNEIELDEPFEYSGEHNLVVVVAKQCLDYDGSLNYYYNMATNSTLYRSGRTASYMNYPALAGTRASYRALAKITFGQPSNCPKVEELAISNVTSSSATLSWTSEGEAWDVYVTNEGDVPTSTTTPTATVEETSYTVTGLAALTSYDAYVRTNCGTETSKWVAVSFTTEPEFSGEGTEEVPYEIATVTDMQNLATAVATGWSTEGVYFEVKNDIEGVNTIIGTENNPFQGVFNGAQHVINVSIEGTTYAGLFGRIATGSYIHDIVVEGTVSATGNFVGGIVGYIGIEAFVDNCENRAAVTGKGYVGGIAGQNSMDGVISNSANKGAVVSTGIAQDYGKNNVGGIVGLNYAGYVENSYNLGSVTGTATGYYVGDIGGIAGTNQYMLDSGGIYNVYNAGEVTMNQGSATTGTNTVGALVGENTGFSGYGYAIVENAYYKEGTYGVAYGAGSTGAAGISNYTSFTQEGTVCTLAEEIEDSTDLLEILNAWIAGNDDYNTWYADFAGNNQNLPCFVESEFGVIFVGTVDDKWSNALNWSNSALPMATDVVIINSDCVLDVNAEIFSLNIAENITLTVASGNVLVVTDQFETESVAQLVLEDGAQLSYDNGEVLATMKRNIQGYVGSKDNYYLLASPVTGDCEVINLTANEFDLFTFDQSQDLEWRNMKLTNEYGFSHGKGYLYANSDEVTLEFAGVLNSGAVTTPLDYVSNVEFAGFNLVGNPYPCNAFISNAYYRMNEAGSELIAGTGAIAPCEAVFVEATAAGQSVEFGKSALRSSKIMVDLGKGRGASIDRAIVRINEGQNLHKMTLNGQSSTLSIAKDGEDYSVLSSSDKEEVMMSFKASENGVYNLAISVEDADVEYLHLVDMKQGIDSDLLKGGVQDVYSYTFEGDASDSDNRFKLVFAVKQHEISEEDVPFAYMLNGNLVIDHIEGVASLQIVDVMGRVVGSEVVSGSYNKGLNLTPGLYIISLDGRTQKIVIE